MGGDAPDTQTVTNTSNPWQPAGDWITGMGFFNPQGGQINNVIDWQQNLASHTPWSGGDPWEGVTFGGGYVKDALGRGSRYSATPYFAGPSDTEKEGLNAVHSALLDAAPIEQLYGYNFDTLSGKYLNPTDAELNSVASGMFGTELQKLSRGDYADINSNPYATAAMEAATRPISRNFTDTILPGLKTSAEAAGRTGSGTASSLIGKAAGETATAIGDTTSRLANQMYEAERGRQVGATNTLANLFQTERDRQMNAIKQGLDIRSNALDYSIKDLGLGERATNLEQTQLNAMKQQYEDLLNNPLNFLSRYLGLASGLGSLGGTQTSQQQYYAPSTLSQILGTGAGLSSIYTDLANAGVV